MTGHVGHNTNHRFTPSVYTNFRKGPFIIMGVFSGTIYNQLLWRLLLFHLSKSFIGIDIKYYFFVLALCVCIFIFGGMSVVVFVFCTLLLLAPLKISIWLLSGPLV